MDHKGSLLFRRERGRVSQSPTPGRKAAVSDVGTVRPIQTKDRINSRRHIRTRGNLELGQGRRIGTASHGDGVGIVAVTRIIHSGLFDWPFGQYRRTRRSVIFPELR